MPRSQLITLTPIIQDTILTVTIQDIIHIVTIQDTAHMAIQAHILLTQGPGLMDIIQVLTVTLAMAHIMGVLTAAPMEAIMAVLTVAPMEVIMGVLTVAPMEAIMEVLTATTAAAPMEAATTVALTEVIADHMEFLLTAVFMEAYMLAVLTVPDYTAAV